MKPVPTRRLKLQQDRTTHAYFTRWTDDRGNRHKRTFGSDKRQAEIRFAEFFAKWQLDPKVRTPDSSGPLTIQQLWDAFETHARAYYRRGDGTPTREHINFEHAFRHVLQVCSSMPAAEFSAAKLKSIRQAMTKAGLCRNVINARVRRIRHVFRWGNAEGVVPADVVVSLESVKALAAFRSEAKERAPVEPVADRVVAATVAAAPPTLRDMIDVQRLTWMRPGEVVIMRACDIDMTGDVWLYRPFHHKLKHMQKPRVIAIGPRAQAIIRKRITADLSAYIFSPRDARHEREVTTATRLKRPHARATDRRVGVRYTTASYYRAILYAARKAGVPDWSPNQLRHAGATAARRAGASIDAIQSQLGHSHVRTTEGYAALDPLKSAEYQRKHG